MIQEVGIVVFLFKAGPGPCTGADHLFDLNLGENFIFADNLSAARRKLRTVSRYSFCLSSLDEITSQKWLTFPKGWIKLF